jgi:hypothetical protein
LKGYVIREGLRAGGPARRRDRGMGEEKALQGERDSTQAVIVAKKATE